MDSLFSKPGDGDSHPLPSKLMFLMRIFMGHKDLELKRLNWHRPGNGFGLRTNPRTLMVYQAAPGPWLPLVRACLICLAGASKKGVFPQRGGGPNWSLSGKRVNRPVSPLHIGQFACSMMWINCSRGLLPPGRAFAPEGPGPSRPAVWI